MKQLVILFLFLFLFLCVWALGRCSVSRILGERNAWKFLWRHLFTYFSFQQTKKLCLFWSLVLWNIKSSSERQSTSYAWESRGKGEVGTPKPCGFSFLTVCRDLSKPGVAREHVQISSPCINGEWSASQCDSRPSPLCPKCCWENGELKATAQHFISGFTFCTNISLCQYFGSIK